VGDTVSYSSSELLALARELSSDRIYKRNDNPIAALEKIIQLAATNDLILITGSLYLVGEIRKKLAKYL
jgi:folylpolyglutamate synthase/dihydropteroate synthase